MFIVLHTETKKMQPNVASFYSDTLYKLFPAMLKYYYVASNWLYMN